MKLGGRFGTGWSRLRKARGQIFDLSYDLKWSILTASLAGMVLAAPAQMIELYRILHAEGRAGDVATLFLAIVSMSLMFWLTAAVTAATGLRRMGSPLPFTLAYSRILPAILGALPLLGCALGHLAAQPNPLDEKVEIELARAGSPWADTAREISEALGTKLPSFAILLFALAAWMLVRAWLRRYRTYPGWLVRLGRVGSRPKAILAVAAIIALLVLLFVASPVAAPRALESFGIVALFFMTVAVTATQLGLLSIRYRFPVIPALLTVALLSSLFDLNDNHGIRRIGDPLPAAPAPHVSDSFERWFASRPDLDRYESEYPVYIVAAQGGGIYAAYQAAVAMARLQDNCPSFRHHLFAVSSVSGGSVGAAMFASALAEAPIAADPRVDCRSLRRPPECPGPLEERVSRALSTDHLSPLLAATLFPDFAQRFLPFSVGPLDRARALEYSFEDSAREAGSARLFTQPFLSHWSATGSAPALAINTTDAASGIRHLIAPFTIAAQKVPIAATGQQPASTVEHFPFWRGEKDLRLSTAAVISARFPWLTPAALVPAEAGRPAIRLVDGGYVDNSGLETALDIYEQLSRFERGGDAGAPRQGAARPPPRPRFIIIAITGGGLMQRGSFALGETMEPIRALLSTRVSRSYVALDRAYRQMPSRSWQESVPGSPVTLSQVRTVGLSNRYYDLPLGWRLSAQTQRIIGLQSGRAWDCQPGRYFQQVAPELAGADCVHALVSAEMNQRMEDLAVEAAAQNFPTRLAFPAESRPARPRFDHEAVLRCFSRRSATPLTYRQNRIARSLMLLWDERPDLKDDRWLAFALGALHVDSAGFAMLSELGGRERLEARYGPESRSGPRLGNVEAGDGWRYRGRGFLFLTGRYNYRKFGQILNLPQLETHPDLLLNPQVSARVAFHYLFIENGGRLRRYFNASREDWIGAKKVVSGGTLQADLAAREARRFHQCIREVAR